MPGATRSINRMSASSASRSMARDTASESSAAGSSPNSAKKLPLGRRGTTRSANGTWCCAVAVSTLIPAMLPSGGASMPVESWDSTM